MLGRVAYSNKYFGVIIEGTTNSAILELMDVVYANTGIYAPSLSIKTTTKSFGSDHVPFQQAGIPAILAIERDDTDYPDYHRTGDSVKNVNTAQVCVRVRVCACVCVCVCVWAGGVCCRLCVGTRERGVDFQLCVRRFACHPRIGWFAFFFLTHTLLLLCVQMADIMAGMAGALWDLANGVLSSTGKGREGARA